MQDFEENINDNISDATDAPENTPEVVPESVSESVSESMPDSEQSKNETPQEVIDPSGERFQHATQKEPHQEETAQEEDPRKNPPLTSRQTRTRSYHAPVVEEYQDGFESEKIEVSTVSRENIVLGEVLDKKYDEMVTVQPVRFASFDNDEQTVGPQRKNLDIMQDVGIRLTVELGRARMKVRKLLEITKGSIIEIDKMAGDQAELFVCGKLVARGEVIVIEDKFGLRIASIVEQKEN